MIKEAERCIRLDLPSLQDIYISRCWTRARKIIKDTSHPNNHLFPLLNSGKRFCSLISPD